MNRTARTVLVSGGSDLPTIVPFLVVIALIASLAQPAFAASGSFILHNTPSYVTTAKNLGPVNPANTIEVSLWLRPHNRAQLDAVATELYNPASPTYRHFLTRSQIAAHFAPTAQEAQTVAHFLEAHNLKVVRVGPNNFFVRARGTVAQIEAAFQVKLNQYKLQDRVIRANNRDPFIDSDAVASLVHAVYGLDNMQYKRPFITRPTSVSQLMSASPLPSAIGNAATASTPTPPPNFFSNTCFLGPETDVFSTNGNGSLPIGTYKGNHLNLPTQTSVGCGYTPPMIQAAYNLNALYAAGFSGQGQTIGVIEACGSLSIETDANAFSAMFGLPPLTPANFAITQIPAPVTCAFDGNIEVNIDVEWAHAIAPGANINVLVAPSASLIDLDEAEFTAVNDNLATVISGSYGLPEFLTSPALLQTENLISEIGAATGISTNFSTGDDGDFSNFGVNFPQFVSAPASSPWATAVGGTSLALNSDNSINWQAGWGTNIVAIANSGSVFDPPEAFGLNSGSGGGASNCVQQSFNPITNVLTCLAGFPKPAFQNKLSGTTRQIPDVSWLADPFTGGVVTFTNPGAFPPQLFQVFGGTSLSCPMFSALWAIANQVAGKPLGQAAPYLYSLPAGAITDVVPFTTLQANPKQNVTASIQEPTVTHAYSAASVLGGKITGPFISGIWDDPFIFNAGVVISFGTDCSASAVAVTPFGNINIPGVECNNPVHLHTKIGWDNVTGLGVPNPPAFVQAFAPAPGN